LGSGNADLVPQGPLIAVHVAAVAQSEWRVIMAIKATLRGCIESHSPSL